MSQRSQQPSGAGVAEASTAALSSARRQPDPAPPADDERSVAGFRLLGKLGSGGMGSVWRARQEAVRREVALKLLDPHLARDPNFVERFMREARAAARVNHPNVVACYDAGRDGRTLWLALELVPGGDAAAAARRSGGRLPEAQALRLGIDCARGLEAIEAAGMIHRDIKPANVFLTGELAAGGVAKLGDLGLARPRAGEERMTLTGAPLGTPSYMSPEQARGDRDLDIRSDVYSLGATLFELVVGQPPFRGETIYAVVSQVLGAATPLARRANPEVSPGLSAVIARAMARRPQDRYAHPAELRAELERLREGMPPLAYSESLGANLSSGLLVRPAIPAAPERRPATRHSTRRRAKWPLVAVGVAAIAGIALAAWLLTPPPVQAGLPEPSAFAPAATPAPAPAPAVSALPPLSAFAPPAAATPAAPAPVPPAPAPAAELTLPPTDLVTFPPAPPVPAPAPSGLESLPAPGTVAAP